MNRLQDKAVIVTGGAVGIGAACVRRMAAEGARVAILDRADDTGRELAGDLVGLGYQARYFHADVASETDVARVFDEVASLFGRLDVLVNNAGIAEIGRAHV